MMIPEQYGYYYYPPPPPPPSSSSHIQAPAATPYFHNTEYPQQPPYPTPGPTTITPTVFNYPSYYNDQPLITDGPQMPIPAIPMIHKPEMPPTPTTQVPHTANTEVGHMSILCWEGSYIDESFE